MADGAVHEAGFRRANDFLQRRDFQPHGLVVSIQFDDEERLAAFELLAAGALASGGESEGVSQLQRARQEAGGKNLADGTGRGAGGIESAGQARPRRRQGQQLERGLGDDAEHPLGADEQAVQIEAGLVLVRASAEADERAVSQRDFEAEHVVAGDAIFEAARATGVGGDVAAEAAIRATRGIRRIEQSLLLHGILQRLGVNARLDDGDEIRPGDFLDAIHPLDREHDAAAVGHASAHVAVARAARGDGNAMVAGEAQDGGDRLRVAREHHGVGDAGGEPFIRRVAFAGGLVRVQVAGRYDATQFPQGGGRDH